MTKKIMINNVMKKKDLIKAIAEANETSIKNTETFYDTFEYVLFNKIVELDANEAVVLSTSIGRFVIKPTASRIMDERTFRKNKRTGKVESVATGNKVEYEGSYVVKFKASQTLKDAVKTKKRPKGR